jgi:hypothetical protein
MPKSTDLPLGDRIAAAIRTPTTSAALTALLDEASSADRGLREALDLAEATALDPLTPAAGSQAAHAKIAAVEFELRRLVAAIGRLQVLRDEALVTEERARRAVGYRAAQEARDALAEELRAVYTDGATRIAAVLAKVSDVDALVATANKAIPAGEQPLLPVVGAARGRGEHLPIPPENWVPKPLLERIKLPALQLDAAPFWDVKNAQPTAASASQPIYTLPTRVA